ncbi:hypothetical protein FACS1894164_06430 [Spirochaetia bacterium]|nr:hypothetical protein FACS1894164_06430 [Spirochaetia bacterium]
MDADYQNKLSAALTARQAWLENSELDVMKNDLRSFQSSFVALYTLYLKKGLINEDPYKEEMKITDIVVPEMGPISESEKTKQLSVRLSNYDSQLDFLVNFYQFSVGFLTIDRIKQLLALIKYIDWLHLSADSSSPTTRAVAGITQQIRAGSDAVSVTIVSGALGALHKMTGSIMNRLKTLSDFHRESYKLDVRRIGEEDSYQSAPTVAQIKQKLASVSSGKVFYPELVEECIKEDYGPDGPVLRKKVLDSLGIPEPKAKSVKVTASKKIYLVDGILAAAAGSNPLTEIAAKIDENEILLEHKRVSMWIKVKRILMQMMNKDPELTVYELMYTDPEKSEVVREKLDFGVFRADLEKRIKNLSEISLRPQAAAKLESMPEDQLITFLQKTVKDIQNLHKTLVALDDYFKTNVDKNDRDRVRGIKPELTALQNAAIKANGKYHDYVDQKEEEEQFKRMGIQTEH